MRTPNTSMQNMKRYGESGSPCLMPLDERKGFKTPPLKRMDIEDEETQLIIRVIKWQRNLKRVKASLIKLHSKWL